MDEIEELSTIPPPASRSHRRSGVWWSQNAGTTHIAGAEAVGDFVSTFAARSTVFYDGRVALQSSPAPKQARRVKALPRSRSHSCPRSSPSHPHFLIQWLILSLFTHLSKPSSGSNDIDEHSSSVNKLPPRYIAP